MSSIRQVKTTCDALKILNRVTGNDVELQRLIQKELTKLRRK